MRKDMVNINDWEKASITVECAISFPFFVSVIIMFFSIINFISSYETINHALDLTCRQLADYAYLYHERAVAELAEKVRNKADTGLENSIGVILEGLPDANKDKQLAELFISFIRGYLHDSIDNVDNHIYIPAAKYLFFNNLKQLCGRMPELFVQEQRIVNGLAGLNFSNSRFFDGNNEISLCLTYEQDPAIPFIPFGYLTVKHQYVMNGWLSGIGVSSIENQENLWELDNFERGRRIRKIFGGNLPYNFPVISSFANGKATIIKSLDFTCNTYQPEGAIRERLMDIINEMASYRGQAVPWGKDKIVIREVDILEREIIIVIPSDPMEEYQESQFNEAMKAAEIQNIKLRIEKYGYKKR